MGAGLFGTALFLVVGFLAMRLLKPLLQKMGVKFTGGIGDYLAMGGLVCFLFVLFALFLVATK